MTREEPEVLERRLLSSIRTDDDLRVCREFGLTAESFTTVIHEPAGADIVFGEVFDYIQSHARDNKGEVPTDEDLAALQRFAREPTGDLKSYAEAVREAELGRRARLILFEHAADLDTNPSTAIKNLATKLASLRLETSRRWRYADRDAADRLRAYDESRAAVEAGGVVGIPTGLRVFDAQGLGFRPGELVIIIGATAVGKSWLLIKHLVSAYTAGKKVLLISPELTAAEQELRFDVVLASDRKVELKHSELSVGKGDRDGYASWLNSLTNRSDFIVVDSADDTRELTFEDVWDLAVEHQPDIIGVDGLYLLGERKAGASRKDWEVLKDGVELMKSLAQNTGTVIIGAHQPDRTANKHDSRTPTISQVGYGKSVADSANRIIAIARVTGQPTRRRLAVPKFRGSQEITRCRILRWEVDHGLIEEMTDQPSFGPDEATAEETGDGGDLTF